MWVYLGDFIYGINMGKTQLDERDCGEGVVQIHSPGAKVFSLAHRPDSLEVFLNHKYSSIEFSFHYIRVSHH